MVDEVVERLMARADASGAALLGEGGLLTEITRAIPERALDAEMTEHLGYERDPVASFVPEAATVWEAKWMKSMACCVGVPRLPIRQWRDAGVFEALLEGLIAEAAKRGVVDLSLVGVDSPAALRRPSCRRRAVGDRPDRGRLHRRG
ncbi:hypothetical protein [Embleya sp. NBC_00896]|uniref:hypothetical protein n=1 Tax=Embleya sp. NBC_00896 TaxID=2975961 RepID=UPI00386A8E9C